jgi:hypothetical protein
MRFGASALYRHHPGRDRPLSEEPDMGVLDRVYSKDTIAKLQAVIAEGGARGQAEGKFEGLL